MQRFTFTGSGHCSPTGEFVRWEDVERLVEAVRTFLKPMRFDPIHGALVQGTITTTDLEALRAAIEGKP